MGFVTYFHKHYSHSSPQRDEKYVHVGFFLSGGSEVMQYSVCNGIDTFEMSCKDSEIINISTEGWRGAL